MNPDSTRFLADLTARNARFYTRNVSDLLVAKFTRNRAAASDARERLKEVIKETMGVAEVIGASSVLQRAAAVQAKLPTKFTAPLGALVRFAEQPFKPITFLEAVAEMKARAPVTLKDAAERTAAHIAALYSEDRVVAFVHAADEAVTEKVGRMIDEALQSGQTESEFGRSAVDEVAKLRVESEPWAESYARMAFRTNVNTATTAGRFRQVQDPDVRELTPAFRFRAVGDSDTRPNHRAANGLIFNVANPVWNEIASPLGYNCRCGLQLLSIFQLRDMGRMNADGTVKESTRPSGAHADKGFRTSRPDLQTGFVA